VVSPALRVLREQPELLALPAQLVQRALLVLPEQSELQVLREQPELQALLVRRALPVLQEPELQALLEMMELLVLRVQ
jgi:hypothetical protein